MRTPPLRTVISLKCKGQKEKKKKKGTGAHKKRKKKLRRKGERRKKKLKNSRNTTGARSLDRLEFIVPLGFGPRKEENL